ncbi:MAG: hypothetical protein LBM38_02350 [Clostridiales bacterium]|jgi:hypothetical protein|nr:hypothetical protein [Clostridiales bacterium]
MANLNDVLKNLDANKLQAIINTPQGQQVLKQIQQSGDLQSVISKYLQQ